jgi:hypothetical protein
MRRFLVIASVSLSMFLAGCESHRAKVDKLQKDYDQKSSQFRRDCAAQYLDIPPKPSPKCQEEDKVQADAWKRLQEEKSRQ